MPTNLLFPHRTTRAEVKKRSTQPAYHNDQTNQSNKHHPYHASMISSIVEEDMRDVVTDIDYIQLFRSLPGRYLVMAPNDPEFTIIEENRAHEEIALADRADVVGKPFFDAFPDTSDYYKKYGISEIMVSFRKVLETRQPDTIQTLKYAIKDKDGELQERWWRATHYPLFDGDNNIVAIFQKTNDITDQILYDARLQQTQYQLDEAMEIGQIGTWSLDIKHNIVTADKNLARMFGVPEDEVDAGLSLQTFTNAIYLDDQQGVIEEIEHSINSGSPYEKEYRTISRDGTVRWVIARGKVYVDTRGEPESFAGIIFDITERKNAELNLEFLARASAELASSLNYRQTLHNIAEMIVPDVADWCSVDIANDEGVFEQIALAHKDPTKIKWVKKYQTHTRTTLDDTTSGIARVVRSGKPEFYPVITKEMAEASATDEEGLELAKNLQLSSAIVVPLKVRDKAVGTLTIVTTEHKRHYTEVDLAMFEDLARRISLSMTNAHFLEETRDQVAELERLQIQLQAANEALETRVKRRTAQLEETNLHLQRSNQELQDFAYIASHDLQEPLRKIQAFGTILEEEYGTTLQDGHDYLTRMRSAAARMSTLIEDLLAFSRVTTQAKELEKIDLTEIVSGVLEDLETRIDETKGTVTINKLPVIQADPLQMRQLFQNLIGNALKFHRPEAAPDVTVNTKTITKGKVKFCEIRISDNGVGFDEKYLDRIFAVFQRLHDRNSYAGTGIGLAVCRKIVERHKGTITATSTPGKGSTFIITLPITQNKQGASA